MNQPSLSPEQRASVLQEIQNAPQIGYLRQLHSTNEMKSLKVKQVREKDIAEYNSKKEHFLQVILTQADLKREKAKQAAQSRLSSFKAKNSYRFKKQEENYQRTQSLMKQAQQQLFSRIEDRLRSSEVRHIEAIEDAKQRSHYFASASVSKHQTQHQIQESDRLFRNTMSKLERAEKKRSLLRKQHSPRSNMNETVRSMREESEQQNRGRVIKKIVDKFDRSIQKINSLQDMRNNQLKQLGENRDRKIEVATSRRETYQVDFEKKNSERYFKKISRCQQIQNQNLENSTKLSRTMVHHRFNSEAARKQRLEMIEDDSQRKIHEIISRSAYTDMFVSTFNRKRTQIIERNKVLNCTLASLRE